MKIYNNQHNDGKHIFVFGSNLAGIHGAGAALQAAAIWGAETGCGEGRTGNAFAIPTKDEQINTLPLYFIHACVNDFLEYARAHPELTFLVTRIGCGLAGYKDFEIAPMFANAPENCDLPEGWEVRRGWRYFECEECKHQWTEPSRDCRSPSLEMCPKCHDCEVYPISYQPDPKLKSDDMGNLMQ